MMKTWLKSCPAWLQTPSYIASWSNSEKADIDSEKWGRLLREGVFPMCLEGTVTFWAMEAGVEEYWSSFRQGYLHKTEKAVAPHSSTLAWKIPWMEEPGRLQSMGSLGVGHNWATSLSHFPFMHWKRKWQPTLVFLPGECQGWGSLVGRCIWGRTESDTTEVT